MTVGARSLNADNVAVVNCLNGDRIICENVGADFRGIVHSVPEFLNELFRVRDSDVLYLSFSVVIGRYRSLSVVIGRYRFAGREAPASTAAILRAARSSS